MPWPSDIIPDPLSLPWRVGRHEGRTIYAQGGAEASREDDELIGVMDTPELAAEACAAHNHMLRTRQQVDGRLKARQAGPARPSLRRP